MLKFLKLSNGIIIVLVCFCTFIPSLCDSQQDTSKTKTTKITLKDESELFGKILSQDSSSINFVTIGKISVVIPKNQIETSEVLSGEVLNGEFIAYDPNDTRLFFSPTARPIKAGHGYFSTYEVFFPAISIGIADVISITGGISLLPGLENQIIYFAPKITPINLENFSAAIGMLYLSGTSDAGDGFGIAYGNATYGNQKASLTAGIGWGFSFYETSETPVFMIGGEFRLSNSIKFITENWIPIDTEYSIISFGIRFFGKRLAADLGFIRSTGSNTNGFPFVPWVGFAYNF